MGKLLVTGSTIALVAALTASVASAQGTSSKKATTVRAQTVTLAPKGTKPKTKPTKPAATTAPSPRPKRAPYPIPPFPGAEPPKPN
jgi:hypothetical protein